MGTTSTLIDSIVAGRQGGRRYRVSPSHHLALRVKDSASARVPAFLNRLVRIGTTSTLIGSILAGHVPVSVARIDVLDGSSANVPAESVDVLRGRSHWFRVSPAHDHLQSLPMSICNAFWWHNRDIVIHGTHYLIPIPVWLGTTKLLELTAVDPAVNTR